MVYNSLQQLRTNIAAIRNDLDPELPADYHLDAPEFLRGWSGKKFNSMLLDLLYGYRKSMELFKSNICGAFRQLKHALPDGLQPGGLVITFGYHSVVMGRNRNLRLECLSLFSHGGAIHDTIASAERFAPP